MKLERPGCKNPIVGLILPTGYSLSLDGTAIHFTLASLFIAQACDKRAACRVPQTKTIRHRKNNSSSGAARRP
jgi:hypothetical protein